MKTRWRLLWLSWLASLLTLAAACGGAGDDDNDAAADDDAGDNDAADDDNAGDDDLGGDDDATDDDAVDDDAFTCDSYHPNSTVGLIACQPGAFEGYTLLAPTMTTTVFLLDMFGRLVNQWPGQYTPGQVVYLLENGQLLRSGNVLNLNFAGGGIGGIVMLQEWDGTVTWRYKRSDNKSCAHHDVRMLPNGNVLMIVWEKKNQAEAIAAGRNPNALHENELWPDSILEVQPVGANDGDIVWEWHAWDHLIQDYDSSKDNYGEPAAHPELIDINYSSGKEPAGNADFMHTNSVDYHEEWDQILISVHNYSETWVLDHGTTTAEAAGHAGGNRGRGGDLLYRWGNPDAYRAASAERYFYRQHDAEWIKDGLPGAGHIMVYNNGVGRPGGEYSSIDEFAPAVDASGDYPPPDPAYGPADLSWTYTAANPASMFSITMSGAQRLANGNTLICVAQSGSFIEVTVDGNIVWKYINPAVLGHILEQGDPIPGGFGGQGNEVFRTYRYAPDFPGFAGHDLTPGECLVEPCE